MRILVINSGSSSIKYKLFQMPQESLLLKGMVEHIGEKGSGSTGSPFALSERSESKGSKIKDHYAGLKAILTEVDNIAVIGHRLVHGAEAFREPVLVDANVIKKIKQCSNLAPLHNPANLAGILACKKLLPGIKQVAVFDTAFYQTLPRYAYIYGLPYAYYKRLGIRKYGFHGSSHEYVASEASRILKKPPDKLKIITCHLGNGCSITAINQGRAVDTSMGFTPLEGLIMGTRCGDIDPALVTYIMRKDKLSIGRAEEILNKASGLKGISGISNDMRVLKREAETGHSRARLAIDIFVYRIKKYIGAYIAIMSGVDVLVFTAGIGENQEGIRGRVCRGLFSHLKKKPRVLVVPTDEELMIARQTYRLVNR